MRIVTNVLEGPEGQKAEVIRSVNGLTQQEVEDGSIPITFADRPMWFLVPAALFQAKLANLKSIEQERRQDLKHFQLLISVIRRSSKSVDGSRRRSTDPPPGVYRASS